MSTPTAGPAPEAVEDEIRRREKALARALIKRLAHQVRTTHPDAVSVHTWWSDKERGQVPAKVLGPHGRVLWTRETDYTGLDREVARYIALNPPTVRLRNDRDGGRIIRLPKARP